MSRSSARSTLLVGPGARLAELGAVLQALATVRGGAPALEPLDDLGSLLERRGGRGRLLLACEEVPGEDIGILRRFLERETGHELVLLGEDDRDPRARRLLALPRARWLSWPPDLEQLAGLLDRRGAEPRPRAPRSGAEPEPEPPAPAPPAAEPATDLDLGALFEEVLAGRSLGGDDEPRFVYRAEERLPVDADRERLAAALDGLLDLAQLCSGAGQAIGVRADRENGSAALAVEFPPGPLTDGDLPGLLEGELPESGPVADAVERLRAAAASVRELGGGVEVAPGRPGRLALRVTLPLATAPAAG